MHDRTHDYAAMALLVTGLIVVLLVPMLPFFGGEPITIAALVARGLKVDELIDAGEVARLVTAGAVHTSFAHLAVNALALVVVAIFWWRIAPSMRHWSRVWLVAAIVIGASTAGFTLSWALRMGLSGGASAGIYGLLAAVAGATWAQRKARNLGWGAPIALTATSLVLVLALLGKSGMDHAAHIGGWAFGFAAGLIAFTRAGRVILALFASACLGLGLS